MSAFTCDAVTYAVKVANAVPIYVDTNKDLTMNYEKIEKNITNKTKAIIIQNTFGRIGLPEEKIKKLKKKNLLIIIDDSLSYGSEFKNKRHSQLGDISVWTFEASKTITIGWGGYLKINNRSLYPKLMKSYKLLHKISLGEDLRKLFQLWISLFFIKKPFYLVLLYGISYI